jgi:hypothetical protein
MPDRTRLDDMTAEELSERAAGFTAFAKFAQTPDLRMAFERLAVRYARLAAERKAEEKRVVQQRGGADG